ncbi:MAG: carboxypeptidase regulatory-like domain-containing protein, partial [Acidobacteria bacterium]|nr:carboxypeptidase regulatory-like domain-containing protein [Acidobacteriota bacterium]
MHWKLLLATVMVVAVIVHPAVSQSTSGSILGDIKDASGAVLPGVSVHATNTATGAVRETVSNEVGAYRLAGLVPARYTVRVELSGFKTIERTVTLPVGGEIKVDFSMEVGQLAESISVTEEAPLVQTTETTVQALVDNRRVAELPLKSRDFMDLMLLAPGVTIDQCSAVGQATDSVSFYGMDEQNKTVWLEGVDFNDEVTMGGTSISEATRTRLGQEAIQEFQVMSSGYSAEFGRTGSGAINVVVKSGGNEVRGSGFYFLRDDSFDKPNFRIVNGVATPATDVPPFKIQQYGATVGGPMKKDKAFYFISLERRKAEDSV